MKKINFMVTAFRDGFQSVYGARVFAKDYMPAVEAAKNAGITHFEAGGGAMFQSPFFYSNENSFDNMDLFRKTAGKDANLQTLARGVNVVGLESQSSDIIKLHADLFKKHGMTTIRNFDALNDVNNLIYSGKCIKDAGLKHEVCVSMMSLAPGWDKEGKTHTPEFYSKILKQILDAGIVFDSVCFKDASGTSTPTTVHQTIALARKMLPEGTKIVFHTHETAGNSIACYLEAIRAGADSIDLSLSPVSGGTCSPDVATMWHALRGSEYTLDIDINKVMEAEKVFEDCMKDYFLPPESKAVDPRIPFAPMPGGALTANTQMMRDNGILDKYNEVIDNMGECVRRGGFGTSVTPVSQFYFQQAFNNTMFGPWKKFADGYGKMVLGYFGKTPVAPDPEIVKLAAKELGLEPTTKPVLEINDANPKKGIKPATEKLQANNLPVTDENIFITAACGDKGIDFLKGTAKVSVRKGAAAAKSAEGSNACAVTIDGTVYNVQLDGDKATVNGKAYNVSVAEGKADASKPAAAAGGAAKEMKAPLPGAVMRLSVNEGDHVSEGQTILVMEAMKMETEVKAISSGAVHFKVKAGDRVATGDALAEIK
ncbi:pyruvate carboxylase subunit B [Elusimicrobium simillimum]|uniref:biotin/lipoyl-containing protein n=1 Tax=Elusimicrobium simillimum TaxID=3143438 RepID=UPI003C6FAD4D